jgi:hypothetical protein
MNALHVGNAQNNTFSREMELEILTRRYLRGEIDIVEYSQRSRNFETFLDLRKLASKLKNRDITKNPINHK